MFKTFLIETTLALPIAFGDGAAIAQTPAKKPNVVMLMTAPSATSADDKGFIGDGAVVSYLNNKETTMKLIAIALD